MITERPIANVEIEAPTSARLGQTISCNVSVNDKSGKAIEAVIPVHVDILDPAGRLGEFSGFYGAKGGQLKLALNLASNDSPGLWEIRVRELASGIETRQYLRVSVK